MLESYLYSALFAAVAATLITRWSGTLLAGPRISKLIEGKLREEVFSRMFPLVILFCLIFSELVPADFGGDPQMSTIKLASVLAVIYLHLWKRNLFISVIGGTVFFALARTLIAGH